MKKFEIKIQKEEIYDLKSRLANARIPVLPGSADFKEGTDPRYLGDVCEYWRNSFDFSKFEKEIDSFPHFTAPIQGEDIHFMHIKGKGDSATPLLLIHGWPDSFLRFKKLIPLLTREDENGHSFTLIIPSIPGFGFSTNRNENNPTKIAKIFNELLTDVLQYERYMVHGGDWGTSIGEKLAQYHPENLLGLHLMDVPFHHSLQKPENASAAEERFFKKIKKWQQTEGAYSMIQSTKPNSLAPALNDSPAGLAAWILEKFKAWSDDFDKNFSKDTLLENLSLYWFTQTAGSAARIYLNAISEAMNDQYNPFEKINPFNHSSDGVRVPTGFSIFPKDISTPPREFAERYFNVVYWIQTSAGGHFSAMEEPEILADELRNFKNALI